MELATAHSRTSGHFGAVGIWLSSKWRSFAGNFFALYGYVGDIGKDGRC